MGLKQIFAHGRSPKWVKIKRQREKKRLNDGDNNGQATHGARKHTWRKPAAWANSNWNEGAMVGTSRWTSDLVFMFLESAEPWDGNREGANLYQFFYILPPLIAIHWQNFIVGWIFLDGNVHWDGLSIISLFILSFFKNYIFSFTFTFLHANIFWSN